MSSYVIDCEAEDFANKVSSSIIVLAFLPCSTWRAENPAEQRIVVQKDHGRVFCHPLAGLTIAGLKESAATTRSLRANEGLPMNARRLPMPTSLRNRRAR
jgi:hypothetical protein